MRPSKLYLEIFISFLLVMIVSETMIFFLFTDSERKIFRHRMEENTIRKVEKLKELIDEKARWMKEVPLTENQEVLTLLASSEIIYDAQIWISDDQGTPLLKPSDHDIPGDIGLLDSSGQTNFPNGIKLHNNVTESQQMYTSVPLKTSAYENLKLYIIFNTGIPRHFRWQFFKGLLIIGIVAAFLIIPVSKFITDRIKVLKASALRIAEGELSHRISVKTKDEIGELGLAFNQMAERLERMIVGGRELTANVSHELRTPLTRIRIAQEMLTERMEKGDASTHERHMNDIREDIEELDTLIGRILELSKLDIHEEPLKYEQFSAASLLEELLEKLGPVIAHKKLAVRKDLLPHAIIAGNRDTLYTALSNILDNATKFTPEEGAIRIEMFQDTARSTISIINTSEALPEKDLKKIFEPFYRSKRSNASGTGLGLSIATRIIQKHGGRISAFNTPNGLEIQVELPAAGKAKSIGYSAEGKA